MLSKTLAIILLCSTISYSQFILNECPDEITCVIERYDTQVTIPAPTAATSNVENCEGDDFSQMSMMFEAPSELVTITALWSTDDNLKMGVVLDCEGDDSCQSFVACNADGEMTITVDLYPGRTYILYIDACDNTIPVDVDVSINPLQLTELFYNDVYLELDPPCGLDESTLCPDLPFRIDFFIEGEEEYWKARNAEWTVSYNGPTFGQVTSGDLDNFLVQIEEPGSYEICFDMVETECFVYYNPNSFCIDIEIINASENLGVYDVCEHELSAGWIPFQGWAGSTITEAGEYEGESENDCGCILNQTVIVNRISEKETEIEVELCPQDYPYDFLGEEEYEYSQQNIEDVVFLEEGSVVEDYSGTACDSVIYLILINEGPQDRCSTCNLPVSLEKGKIVFCLPFDNATVDVSGQNTIVRPTGINYDDNGSSENDFWEAILDGDEDYITIPHIDNLNTSVFSLNFQFNKDERFENGNTETLVSKGDIGKDNLRYDVSLQKVNESIFDLKGSFYTANGLVEVDMPNLQIFNWYDVAYVVEPDTISLYLDGYIFSKTPIAENLKGNTEDLYIGTLINSNTRTQFYNGRLDNFKYWKQKLSGQDVFFLHFPEKEFEVEQSYFLSCCEQAEFRDVLIDINNPLDSVIIANASPTGYDSVYILNYIQADPGPELNTSLAPQDIVVQYQQSCQELCQSTVNWAADLNSLFTDNCGNVTVTQSHNFDVVLDENISFVEVSITGTDDCGQSTVHSFGLELECLPSTVIAVPEQNVFELMSNELCVNEYDEICIFSDIQLQLGFLNELTNTMESYESGSEFDAIISIDGVDVPLSPSDVNDGYVLDNLTEGTYVVCLTNVSSACESIENDYCQTITIRSSNTIDHGEIETCRDDIEASLPSDISQDLRNLILSNPQEAGISVTEEDGCGCEDTEKISLIINDVVEEELSIVLCEGEIFDGRTEDEVFTVQLMASNGCDSLVTVDLKFLPKSYLDVFVEICPDSTYMGYNEAGVYEIMEVNAEGCDSITTLNLSVLDEMDPSCFVSSLQELVEQKFTVFPNPVTERLNILSNNNAVIQNSIIYSTDGKIAQVNNNDSNIDVSKLNVGVYILKIITSDSKSSAIRFIKNQ